MNRFLAALAVAASTLAVTTHAQPPARCSAVPAVAGFHLGDSVSAVVRRYPRLPLPPRWGRVPLLELTFDFREYYGRTTAPAEARIADSAGGHYDVVGHPPTFENVSDLTLDFRAGRLVAARVLYVDESLPPHVVALDAYTRHLSDSLALPARWRPLSAAERKRENVWAGRRVTCAGFRFDVANFMRYSPGLVYAVATGPEVTSQESSAALDTILALGRVAEDSARAQNMERDAAVARHRADSVARVDGRRRPTWFYELVQQATVSCVFHLELLGPAVDVPISGLAGAPRSRADSVDRGGPHTLREVGVQARVLGAERPPGGGGPNAGLPGGGLTCDPNLPAARKLRFPSAPDRMILILVDESTVALRNAVPHARVEALYVDLLGALGEAALYYVRRE